MITEKPITNQRLPWVKEAQDLLFEHLPIHRFEAEQRRKRSKMKF